MADVAVRECGRPAYLEGVSAMADPRKLTLVYRIEIPKLPAKRSQKKPLEDASDSAPDTRELPRGTVPSR